MPKAMSKVDALIQRISNAEASMILDRRTGAESCTFGDDQTLQSIDRLPEDMRIIREHFEAVKLFGLQTPFARNGWFFGENLACWPYFSVNEFIGEPGRLDYLDDVWVVAHSSMDGSVVLGVDLHPDGFGRIGLVSYTDILVGGGSIVVALTFSEWLERTLDLGPEAEAPYWRQNGFKDYGPLIPGDPYYRPVEPLHEV